MHRGSRQHSPKILLVCTIFISVIFHAEAQETLVDSSNASRRNHVSLGFEKNINTYNWNFLGQLNYDLGGWSISAEERYLTTVISSDENRIKDDQSFTMQVSKSLGANVDFITQLNSFIFSDTRTLGLNRLSTNKFLSGMKWKPFNSFSFMPSVGYAFDNQQSISDQGMIYRAIAELEGYPIGDNLIAGIASYSQEDISPRAQDEQLVQMQLQSLFGDDSRNLAALQYRSFSRDFYILSDTISSFNGDIEYPIETRDETSYAFSNGLMYDFSEPFSAGLNVSLSQRTISRIQKKRVERPDNPAFDTDVDEFRANVGLELQYNTRHSFWKTRFELSERDETHTVHDISWANPEAFARQQNLEEQKNNAITQTKFVIEATERFGTSDTLTFTGSSLKMEYNTPSENNNDDRDELFLLSGIRWAHRFSPHFYTSLTGDVTMRHTVYLFSERSANNNWNRIFRLAPATHFRLGDVIHSVNAAEVLANYTVYDFETVFPEARSFSFRQLTISDSTTVRLGRRISISTRLQFRFFERGELRWDDFKVRPTTFFDERTYVLFLSYEEKDRTISAGFRMFDQTQYGYQGNEKIRSGRLQSYGPTCIMQFRTDDELGVLIDGWYQITKSANGETRTSPSVLIRLFWYL
jgi:hypothetical protein